jgi:flagellar protein FlgJ
MSKVQNVSPLLTAKTLNQQRQLRRDLADPKLYRVCQDFEAVLFKQMLEVMQSSTPMFGKGFGGSYFQGLFQEEIAKEMAAGQGIGLADNLYAQLMRAKVRTNPEKEE